jgi:uncharacterized protein with PQ loop repeat
MFGYQISDVLGVVALIITMVYTFFGLPAQIVNNFKKKSTAGLSLFLMIMLTMTFSIWTLYSYIKEPPDWYVFSSNFPGIIFGLVIIYQFWLYRKN